MKADPLSSDEVEKPRCVCVNVQKDLFISTARPKSISLDAQ